MFGSEHKTSWRGPRRQRSPRVVEQTQQACALRRGPLWRRRWWRRRRWRLRRRRLGLGHGRGRLLVQVQEATQGSHRLHRSSAQLPREELRASKVSERARPHGARCASLAQRHPSQDVVPKSTHQVEASNGRGSRALGRGGQFRRGATHAPTKSLLVPSLPECHVHQRGSLPAARSLLLLTLSANSQRQQ